MLGARKVTALIPARGGSKRLPRKNVLTLKDKPLIAWTIEAALNSECVDDVIVSTDDSEIAEIAKQYGASLPFTRPRELATDGAKSNDVILHALSHQGLSDGIMVLLQPTSPLRSSSDIDNALQMFLSAEVEGVVSVCECEHSPLWANTLPVDKSMGQFLNSLPTGARSQDLPQYYRLNGAIYAFDIKCLLTNEGIYYSDKVFAHLMTHEHSIDIDTQFDFLHAEVWLSQIK